MDTKQLLEKISQIVKQYKYVVMIVLVGIFLMMLPSGKSEETPQTEQTVHIETKSMEERLTEVLSQIRGAGKVRVMLTEEVGAETIYKTDESISMSGDSSSSKKDTVTVTDENRAQNGLITQVNPPKYQGAVIVCKGADDPRVRLAIVSAVSSLTGLKSDKITIVRMK